MAKFSIRPHNTRFFLSHPTNPHASISRSIRATPSLSRPQLLRLSIRVRCSIREKENVKRNEEVPSVLSGLRVDESERIGSISKPEDDSSSGNGVVEVGSDANWPPWKNVPERYKLIGTTALAFVICNMDKVNLSVAIIPMSHQFGWNSSVAGLVQSSFFWGYALSQLPGGWLAKIFGGRKVLEIGVLTWSLATALVPFLAGYMPGLILSRILVGIGEGVSPSAATDLIARSIPLQERSRAVAFVFGGLSVGSVSGLLLAPSLIQNLGWESVFYIFGILGIAWFAGFQFLDGQGPASSTAIPVKSNSASKLKHLPAALKEVPWKAFMEYPPLWAMIYTHFCGSWGHYTCLSWLPTYFSEELNLNLTEAAWVRKICQTIAFVSPAVCMTLSSVDLGLPPWEVVGILTTGLALSSFALSGLYCTHQDMSPEYASVLLGITNTVGAIPGIIGVALTGFLLDSTHSWSISLFAPSIFFYLTGTIIWLVFASSKPQSFSKNEE
ncbi:probable anion transporter 6, chloroplastic isoform X2 [Momordica charantia]|uniref:Probable anion transporter 6, chloroplastic isoform X2 n=1 Tax=Momordica charantia TaxID=3673 RepID=A0A6J1CPL4_MOMCH|nr:probable anion transporter 6, chloroplastic isoform X2 [Momordica charantia]